MSQAQQRIADLVQSNEVVLFMKGNASFPQCGFSGRAIQVLKACGVDTKTVKTVNVLEDDEIRQGIKTFSQWPTIPQLYVRGEFVGGSDIMMIDVRVGRAAEGARQLSARPARGPDPVHQRSMRVSAPRTIGSPATQPCTCAKSFDSDSGAFAR